MTRAGRRVWMLVVFVVVITVAIGAVLFVKRRAKESDTENPRNFALPSMDDQSATLQWLEGPGAVVVTMAEATRSLTTAPPTTPGACEAWTATNLNPLGRPADVIEQIAESPDDATGQIALNHFDVVTRWLAGCIQQTAGPTDVELAATQIVLDRQIERIEHG